MKALITLAQSFRRPAAVLMTLGLAIAALAVPASAQFTSTFRVHVPFAFSAGKVELPAGDYVVRRQSTSVLIIQNEATDESAILSTTPVDWTATSSKDKLVFVRSDKGTTLAQARWFDGTMTYRALPSGSHEQLATNGGSETIIAVIAK